MFGGLITHTGHVKSIISCGSDAQLWIQSCVDDWVVGESVAVDGACLTVTSSKDDCFSCLVSHHTLSVTIAAYYQPNRIVNLERALRLNDRIGGHLLTGHIDSRAVMCSRKSLDACWQMTFKCDSAYLTHKGSVAINGVSLTVNAVNNNSFDVMIILHTYIETNLCDIFSGDDVNIEYDQQVKVIVNYMRTSGIFDGRASG